MQVERVWQLIIGYHRPASPWSNWSSVRSKLGFVMPNSAEKIEKQVASHIVSVCWRSCNAIWLLSACCLLSGLADAQSTSDLSARLVGTPVITVHGTAADAEFVYDLKGNNPARGNFDQRLRFHAKMQRTEQHWIILSVGAAP